MNRNGNNLGVSVGDVIENQGDQELGESTFYDSSNPVLAPAKATDAVRKKTWKRKLVGWSLVTLLIVVGGLVLYSLLKIKHVDVKVLADNRRDGLNAKPESSPNKTENGLSAEAINIAREAIGTDSPTSNNATPSASTSVSPAASSDTNSRVNYSATVYPGLGPVNDIGTGTVNANTNPGVNTATTQQQSRPDDVSASQAALQSRINTTQSIFVDDTPSKALGTLARLESTKVNPRIESNKTLAEKPKNKSAVLPPFGTMLPVRTQAVIFTVRNNSYARLELTRDLSGEGWSLPKGTLFIGRSTGSELDRAFINVIGYVDPRENRFVKMTGEVLGSDGGAGLPGKRVVVDRNRFKQTLAKVASNGLQVAGMMAGALTGRGTVVVNGAGYRLLNPVTDEADHLVSGASDKRSFVKVAAGQSAYVMVADLPRELSSSDAPGEDELERAATSLTDREVMELILLGTPDEVRGALPLMNDEQRAMVVKIFNVQDVKP